MGHRVLVQPATPWPHVYLALLVIELFWWPKRQAQQLFNAERAAETARSKSRLDPAPGPT